MEFIPGNRNHHHFSDDVAAMSSNSFASAKSATAKLKMKMLPAGFPVALCNTAIQHCDRQSNRSFLLLRIADLVVDAVDVVDVRSQRSMRFRQVSILHFEALHKSRYNRLISNISFA